MLEVIEKVFKYVVASVLILAIVFVEEIDVLFIPITIVFVYVLLFATTLFLSTDMWSIVLLFAILFILIVSRYSRVREKEDQNIR